MGKKEKAGVFAILIGIIIFHIVNNYIISTIDLAPFFHDIAQCIKWSFRTYSLLVQYKFFDVFLGFSPYQYPPLFHIISFPFYWLFGLNQKSAVMTNFIFLVILVFSIYGVGRLLHSKKAGILAAFIVTSFPGVFALSRTYYHNFALTAMVVLSIYCLLKTEKFTQKIFCFFLGLTVGLGTAIKPSFILFFLGPFCYYLFISFNHACNRAGLFKRIKNLIIFLVIGLILILFFYIPNFWFKINYSFNTVFGTTHGPKFEYFSLENILAYPKYLFTTQILYFYFALFLPSIVLFLKDRKKYKFLLFLWLFVPYLFFTFCVRRFPVFKYTAPYLPAIALIISITLFDLRKVIVRRVLIFLIVFIGLFQFFLISYVPQGSVLIDRLNYEFFSFPNNKQFSQEAYFLHERFHAYNTDYGVGAIVDYIKKSDRINKQNNIRIFDATAYGIARPTEYLLYQNGGRLYYYVLCNRFPGPERVTEECITELTKMLDDIDFLVLSSDIDKFADLKNLVLKNMKLVKIIDSEDGRDLYLFENVRYHD